MKKYNTLKEIIEQLELPKYQTKDGLHSLIDNAAFCELKEMSQTDSVEIIDDLKYMSNNYQTLNGQCVISKNVLDVYIQQLEFKKK